MGRPPKSGPFPTNIRPIRERRGLTLDQLGEKVGRTGSAVARTERGIHDPRLGEIRRFAAALQVPVSELIGDGPRDDQEREMMETFRKLSADDRDRLLKMARALAP